MNIYFSRVIKAGEKQREFNFRCLSNTIKPAYDVDVNDDKGNRIFFSMYCNDEGKWKTSNESLPVWIQNAEPILGNAIEEHMKQ